jgi:hypothetical protein
MEKFYTPRFRRGVVLALACAESGFGPIWLHHRLGVGRLLFVSLDVEGRGKGEVI